MYSIEIFIVNIVILAIALSVWLGTSETSTKAVTYKSHDGTYVCGEYNTSLTLYHGDQTPFGTTLSGTSTTDVFIAKYDKDGKVKWVAKQSGTNNDISRGVSTDRSGNVYVAGYYHTDLTLYNSDQTAVTTLSGTHYDGFLAKYDKDGKVVWAANLSSPASYGVSTDRSGNVYVAGEYDTALTLYHADQTAFETTLSGTDTRDGFIAKYDKDGTVQWAANQTGTNVDISWNVSTDRSGNVYVAGYYITDLTLHSADQTEVITLSGTAYDGFLAKYDKDGKVKWAANQTGTSSDASYSVSTDRNGNVYVAGEYNTALTLYNSDQTPFDTTLSATTATEGFIAKYDKDGTVQWAAKQNGTSVDASWYVSTDRSGNVYVAGRYNTDLTLYHADQTAFETTLSGTSDDGFIAKYDKDGKVKWAAKQTGTGTDYSRNVSTDRNGNVYVAGEYNTALTLYNSDQTPFDTTLSGTSTTDGFLAKYDKDGNVIWAANQTGTDGTDRSYSVSSYYYLEEVQ